MKFSLNLAFLFILSFTSAAYSQNFEEAFKDPVITAKYDKYATQIWKAADYNNLMDAVDFRFAKKRRDDITKESERRLLKYSTLLK